MDYLAVFQLAGSARGPQRRICLQGHSAVCKAFISLSQRTTNGIVICSDVRKSRIPHQMINSAALWGCVGNATAPCYDDSWSWHGFHIYVARTPFS